MLTNLSVSGVPFVGADVGGFAEMPSGELYARWLQSAALTPFLRSHSVGWVGNKEPWAFGEEFTRINRETIELRYRFLPYLYSVFRDHERTGEPVMRPLWYEFPNDKQTYLIDDEYMVGGDILVARGPAGNDYAGNIFADRGGLDRLVDRRKDRERKDPLPANADRPSSDLRSGRCRHPDAVRNSAHWRNAQRSRNFQCRCRDGAGESRKGGPVSRCGRGLWL